MSVPLRCGWCETSNPPGRAGCVNCGGPLRPPGADPGPPPPPAPRALPDVFVRRVSYARNGGVRFGLAFATVGALASLGFAAGAVLVPLMAFGLCVGLPFVGIGAAIAATGWRSGQARLEVLRAGAVTTGRVEEVRDAGAETGRPSWTLTYRFEVDGRAHPGEVTSTDAEITRFEPGYVVHVVYRPERPAHNDIWPLLA